MSHFCRHLPRCARPSRQGALFDPQPFCPPAPLSSFLGCPVTSIQPEGLEINAPLGAIFQSHFFLPVNSTVIGTRLCSQCEPQNRTPEQRHCSLTAGPQEALGQPGGSKPPSDMLIRKAIGRGQGRAKDCPRRAGPRTHYRSNVRKQTERHLPVYPMGLCFKF